MQVVNVSSSSPYLLEAHALWEQNMQEPWQDYAPADMFILIDNNDILGGFAVYYDESDGVTGNFCSGWAKRHSNVPIEAVLKRLAWNVGDVYFKTQRRTAKILLEKIGEKVKTVGRFVYYVIRGNKNGFSENRKESIS